jgi:mannose-6-phosphate isomerase-like protein (cupin superfamily)
MAIFNDNIRKLTLENSYFRKVIFTGPNAQLVLMSLKPSEDIGEEIHKLDQILFFVEGSGKAVLDGAEYEIKSDSVFYVPKGTKHNFINTGNTSLKLYTVYTPAEHADGVIHKTKEEAMMEEHRD